MSLGVTGSAISVETQSAGEYIQGMALVNVRFEPDRAVTLAELSAMLTGAEEIINDRNSREDVSNFMFADYVKVIPESVLVEYHDGSLLLIG